MKKILTLFSLALFSIKAEEKSKQEAIIKAEETIRKEKEAKKNNFFNIYIKLFGKGYLTSQIDDNGKKFLKTIDLKNEEIIELLKKEATNLNITFLEELIEGNQQTINNSLNEIKTNLQEKTSTINALKNRKSPFENSINFGVELRFGSEKLSYLLQFNGGYPENISFSPLGFSYKITDNDNICIHGTLFAEKSKIKLANFPLPGIGGLVGLRYSRSFTKENDIEIFVEIGKYHSFTTFNEGYNFSAGITQKI